MTKKKDLTYEQHFDTLYQDMINYEEQANMGMMDEAIKDTVKEKGFTKTDLRFTVYILQTAAVEVAMYNSRPKI